MVSQLLRKRGLSTAIAILILMVIIVSLAIPFLFYLQYMRQSSQVTGAIVSNYVTLKQLQYESVVSGHPAIYYSAGTKKASVIFEYTNGTFVPPISLTITGILYFNNGVWQNITTYKYPIVINSSQSLQIPSYASINPIIIVTSLGSVFFLAPNTSIGPYSLGSKGGVEILAQITTHSNIYEPIANVTTNIMGGKFKNYTVPVAFPNITGTFQAKVPQYVYYEFPNGTVITGQFHNWIIQGKAIVNSTQTEGITVTLERQGVVLIANYTPVTTYITLNVQVVEPNAPQVQPISVQIDGKTYQVPGTVRVLAGFVSVIIPQGYLKFNNTLQESKGYIYSYEYNYSVVGNTKYVSPSFVFFVNPQTSSITLTIYYTEEGYYVRVNIVDTGQTNYNYYFVLNGTVYNYGQSYWILAGKYLADPTGIFVNNLFQAYSIGAVNIYYNNVLIWSDTEYTQIIINITQPGTITVQYGIQYYYQQL